MYIHSLLFSLLIYFLFVHRMPLWMIAAIIVVFCIFLWLNAHTNKAHGIIHSLDYYAQKSKIKSKSAALKSLFCIGSLVLCVASSSSLYCWLIFFLMLLYSVGIGKTPIRYYLSCFQTPLLFIALSGLTILFDLNIAPNDYWSYALLGRYLSISLHNQQRAWLLLSRAMGAVSCLYAYSLSTPLSDIIKLMRSIKCPDIVIELMYLSYRYIFALLNIYRAMNDASNARFGNWNLKSRYRSFLYSVQNLLFLSFQRARSGFDAMEARCYDGKLQFFSERSAICAKDIGLVVGYLFMIIGLFVLCMRDSIWLS